MSLTWIIVYSDSCVHHPFYICESKIVLNWVRKHIYPAEVGSWAHREEEPWLIALIKPPWSVRCVLIHVETHFGNTYHIYTRWLLNSLLNDLQKCKILVTYVIIYIRGIYLEILHPDLLHSIGNRKLIMTRVLIIPFHHVNSAPEKGKLERLFELWEQWLDWKRKTSYWKQMS